MRRCEIPLHQVQQSIPIDFTLLGWLVPKNIKFVHFMVLGAQNGDFTYSKRHHQSEFGESLSANR